MSASYKKKSKQNLSGNDILTVVKRVKPLAVMCDEDSFTYELLKMLRSGIPPHLFACRHSTVDSHHCVQMSELLKNTFIGSQIDSI